MNKELGLLNFICLLVAIAFLVMAGLSAFGSGDFLTIDNLFIITVCLVMALMFVAVPLLHLKSEGKLPLPFIKSAALPAGASAGQIAAKKPPLLDAKGRAVPPDVKAIVSKFEQVKVNDA